MVGYLGPVGTFSYMAALNYTKKGTDNLKKYPSIYSLIKAVDAGEIEAAVVPIENSIEGSVNSTLDTLAFNSNLYICGEYTMRVSENLMALKGVNEENIKKIISHPQPIGQCAGMINTKFPDVQISYTESTAAAARLISEEKLTDTAMIGPSVCAEMYGLEILCTDCGDEKNNSTRFVELRRTPNKEITKNDKTSLVFALENKPGVLFKAIEIFAKRNINMIKIESRPAKVEMGEYIFFIDIDGNIEDNEIKKAWEQIQEITVYCKCMGSYKKG